MQHVLDLRPEVCSLDMGSMNMGANVFVNTPAILELMAIDIRDAGVTPELEVFEAGHLLLAKRMIETGHIKPRRHVPDLPRHRVGPAATPEAMAYMRTLLPAGATWFAFGISLHQFPMAAQAVLLGGHVRVGLEDNLYLERGRLTPSNAAPVAKAGKIVELLGCGVSQRRPRRAQCWGSAAPRSRQGRSRRRSQPFSKSLKDSAFVRIRSCRNRC